MAVPNIAHFVYGFAPQDEPFHLAHYLAIESCRQVLQPDAIYLHHRSLPWGRYWDLIRPHLTLVEVEAFDAVDSAADAQLVPERYRYAHHADFVRLDALIEHGGLYADIDTLFVRPYADELWQAPFVIGREPPVRDERTGQMRPSLCNAILLSEPGAAMAVAWRERMAGALNGTWSNHSGFLAAALAEEMPHAVRIEPEETFFAYPATVDGLRRLLEEDEVAPAGACSVHLWGHLWWRRDRIDFSAVHAGHLGDDVLRTAATTYARLARPYLPEPLVL
jgi:hypothetical protein